MKKLLVVIYCLSTISAFSQNVKNLDLSKTENSESVEPQTITGFKLVNGLATPGTAYSISYSIKHNFQMPLSIPNKTPDNPTFDKDKGCSTLETAIDKLKKEPFESQIPKDIEDLQKELAIAPASCSNNMATAQAYINATKVYDTTLQSPIIIGKNDELDITITRNNIKWSFVFKNIQPNHWTTYYGFTYIPDILTKFTNYYANQQQGDSFIISKMNGGNKNVLQNVSPTAMFTYRIFCKKPDEVFKFGITGGIFYNTEILGAMFGPSLIIGDNVTLNTGISFVQKYKLKGQYHEGQTIHENLDFNQLHDKIWTYDIFISIGFNIPELFTKKNNTTVTQPSGTSGH